jgi:hypothetical protein
LEVVTEPGLPLQGQQMWGRALEKIDVQSVRIRAARSGEGARITNRGSDNSPAYHVLGVLKSDNRLVLPDARPFAIGDTQGIARWLEQLRAGGPRGLTSHTGAFGLTSDQLLGVHQQLAVPLRFSTKGKDPVEVVDQIADLLPLPVQLDAAARQALATSGVVRDELNGISSGTALAAALRPAGLAVVPRSAPGGEISLQVVDSRQATEIWPVGWPCQAPPREAMPQLFKFLPVEIQDFSLQQALDALAGRLEAPLLFDHNSMARHQIDPGRIKVNLPQSTTYYKSILDRLLFQAKLKSEIRMDEADRPFLWVAPIKN